MTYKMGTYCGECVHFPICSKLSVKNVKKDTDHCQWMAPGMFQDNELRLIESIGLTLSENNV